MPVIPKPPNEPPLFGGNAQVVFGHRQPTGVKAPVEGDKAATPRYVSLIERWASDVFDLESMKVPPTEPDQG